MPRDDKRTRNQQSARVLIKYMKPTSLLIGLFALAAFLPGCTTTTTTTTAVPEGRPDVEITSEKRSYSQRELQKRGQPTVGGALEAQDPSVYISRGGRR